MNKIFDTISPHVQPVKIHGRVRNAIKSQEFPMIIKEIVAMGYKRKSIIKALEFFRCSYYHEGQRHNVLFFYDLKNFCETINNT